jgi:hypothetical protein
MQELDRKTRKMLTIHGQHHSRADFEHSCVPRKGGGRGQIQTEGAYITELKKLMEYVESKEDLLITDCYNTPTAHKLQTVKNFLKVFSQ